MRLELIQYADGGPLNMPRRGISTPFWSAGGSSAYNVTRLELIEYADGGPLNTPAGVASRDPATGVPATRVPADQSGASPVLQKGHIDTILNVMRLELIQYADGGPLNMLRRGISIPFWSAGGSSAYNVTRLELIGYADGGPLNMPRPPGNVMRLELIQYADGGPLNMPAGCWPYHDPATGGISIPLWSAGGSSAYNVTRLELIEYADGGPLNTPRRGISIPLWSAGGSSAYNVTRLELIEYADGGPLKPAGPGADPATREHIDTILVRWRLFCIECYAARTNPICGWRSAEYAPPPSPPPGPGSPADQSGASPVLQKGISIPFWSAGGSSAYNVTRLQLIGYADGGPLNMPRRVHRPISTPFWSAEVLSAYNLMRLQLIGYADGGPLNTPRRHIDTILVRWRLFAYNVMRLELIQYADGGPLNMPAGCTGHTTTRPPGGISTPFWSAGGFSAYNVMRLELIEYADGGPLNMPRRNVMRLELIQYADGGPLNMPRRGISTPFWSAGGSSAYNVTRLELIEYADGGPLNTPRRSFCIQCNAATTNRYADGGPLNTPCRVHRPYRPATGVPCPPGSPPTNPAPILCFKKSISTPFWSAEGSSAYNVMRLQLIKYADGGPLNMPRRNVMRLELIQYADGGPLNMPAGCNAIPRPGPGSPAHQSGANPVLQKGHIDTILNVMRLELIQYADGGPLNMPRRNVTRLELIEYADGGPLNTPRRVHRPYPPGHPGPPPTNPAPVLCFKKGISIPLWSAGGSSAYNVTRLQLIGYADGGPLNMPRRSISTPFWSAVGSSAYNVMRLQLIKYADGGPLNMPRRGISIPLWSAEVLSAYNHIDTILVRCRLCCIECYAARTNPICGRRSAEYARRVHRHTTTRPPGSPADQSGANPVLQKGHIDTTLNVTRLELIEYADGGPLNTPRRVHRPYHHRPPEAPAHQSGANPVLQKGISTPFWSAGGSSAYNVTRLQLIGYADGGPLNMPAGCTGRTTPGHRGPPPTNPAPILCFKKSISTPFWSAVGSSAYNVMRLQLIKYADGGPLNMPRRVQGHTHPATRGPPPTNPAPVLCFKKGISIPLWSAEVLSAYNVMRLQLIGYADGGPLNTPRRVHRPYHDPATRGPPPIRGPPPTNPAPILCFKKSISTPFWSAVGSSAYNVMRLQLIKYADGGPLNMPRRGISTPFWSAVGSFAYNVMRLQLIGYADGGPLNTPRRNVMRLELIQYADGGPLNMPGCPPYHHPAPESPPTNPAPILCFKKGISTPFSSAGGSFAYNVMRLQLIGYADGGPLNMPRRVHRPYHDPAPGSPAHQSGANPVLQKSISTPFWSAEVFLHTIAYRHHSGPLKSFCIQCDAATTNRYADGGPLNTPCRSISTPFWSAEGSSAYNVMRLQLIKYADGGPLNTPRRVHRPYHDPATRGPPPTNPAPILCFKKSISIPFWSAEGSSAYNVMRLQLIGYADGGPLNTPRRVHRPYHDPATGVPAQSGANPVLQKKHIDTILVRCRLFCIQCNAATTNQICGRRSAEYAPPGAQAIPPRGPLPTNPAPILCFKKGISIPLWSAEVLSAYNVMRLQLIGYADGGPLNTPRRGISTPFSSAVGSSAYNVMRLQLIGYADGGPLNTPRRVHRPYHDPATRGPPPTNPAPILCFKKSISTPFWSAEGSSAYNVMRLQLIKYADGGPLNTPRRVHRPYHDPATRGPPPTNPAPVLCFKKGISIPLWSAEVLSAYNVMRLQLIGYADGGPLNTPRRVHRPYHDPATRGPPPTNPAPILCFKKSISTPFWSAVGSSAYNVMRLQLIKYADGGPLNMPCRVHRPYHTRPHGSPADQSGANPVLQKKHIDTILADHDWPPGSPADQSGANPVLQKGISTPFWSAEVLSAYNVMRLQLIGYADGGPLNTPRRVHRPYHDPSPGPPPTNPAPILCFKKSISTPFWSAVGSSAYNVMRLQLIGYADGGPLNMPRRHIDTILVRWSFCIQCNAATTNRICGRRSAEYAPPGAQAVTRLATRGPRPPGVPCPPTGANCASKGISTPFWSAGGSSAYNVMRLQLIGYADGGPLNMPCRVQAIPRPVIGPPPTPRPPIRRQSCASKSISTPFWSAEGSSAYNVMRLQLIGYADGGPLNTPRRHIDTILVRWKSFCIQ
eukprot:gene12830-8726_t